jgi:hypothetical protein
VNTWPCCGGGGSIFIGNVSPMNIFLYFSAPKNIKNYIRRCYIPLRFHRLTDEFILYFLVIQLYSTVETDEFLVVSCSVLYKLVGA